MDKKENVKLGAGELREYEPTAEEVASVERNGIYIIVDNVLDTYNIGSVFRLADAVAAKKVFLAGRSAAPDDPKVGHRIHKAAVGTHKWVPWEYVNSVEDAVEKVKSKNLTRLPDGQEAKIVAVEQAEDSLDYREADLSEPVAFIVGHETTGVSDEGLELADEVVELPLYGVNKSLNVLVALAIICYKTVE